MASLNHFCSPGRCHGILFLFPITRFRVIATIAFIQPGIISHPLLAVLSAKLTREYLVSGIRALQATPPCSLEILLGPRRGLGSLDIAKGIQAGPRSGLTD